MQKNKIRGQAIALTGLWQAVNLVNELANNDSLDNQQTKRFNNSVKSILVLDADEPEMVYGSVQNLEFSILEFYSFLTRKNKMKPHILRYMLQVTSLQSFILSNREMSSYIGEELYNLKRKDSFLSSHEYHLIESLANIYSKTLGSLPMNKRIKVAGKPSILQKEHIQNAIRAMLLAGIRSSMLWRQMGGNYFQLIMNRKKIERSLASLSNYR